MGRAPPLDELAHFLASARERMGLALDLGREELDAFARGDAGVRRSSLTTGRSWMLDDGVWKTRRDRDARAYQPRYRRACFGELVQIDGCLHPWCEGRAPECAALVYVDDATSRMMELRLVLSESTFDCFASTRSCM